MTPTALQDPELSYIRELYAHDEWANARFLAAAAELDSERYTRDLGSSFPSIQDTLSHVVVVEWVWLRRWHGESPSAPPAWAEAPDAASLRARLSEIEAERGEWMSSLGPQDLARHVSYHSVKGDLFEYPLRDQLLHLAIHSNYHRGQLTTMFRQIGATPPATDFLVFRRAAEPQSCRA